MIDVWLEKIPDQCILVKYEDLVKNPETTLNSIAEFVGLDLDCSDLQINDDSGGSKAFSKLMIVSLDYVAVWDNEIVRPDF